MSARRVGFATTIVLVIVYVLTLAPGVTFWDAGEFITAAHVLGIPHPPGTPLYVALGRVWTMALGGALGVARAMNLLSAVATACAAGVSAALVAHATRAHRDGGAGAMAGALCAGLMLTVWANATETEVYAIALLHVVLLLGAAYRASVANDAMRPKWVLLVAYLIALVPAVHLSVLIGAPAAILLAARDARGDWNHRSTALLIGTAIMAVGVGRMSAPMVIIGGIVTLSAAVGGRESYDATEALGAFALTAVGASALLILMVRAQAGPALNQGDPSSFTALADLVARRQYDLAPLWPRRAPVWLQLASIGQYADWQAAMGWGDGVFTSPLRVIALFVFMLLGVTGWSALRRDSRRLADALLVLLVSGTVGVVGYLNMKAGVSIGYGIVPRDAHEARERDYFFVLGFWAWGLLAGYGALAVTRARKWPTWGALAVGLIPLLGNWSVADRRTGLNAIAPRMVAAALLSNAPPRAVLFLAGDNDTYPIWYMQQVEGFRRDVTPVTIPLLGAEWYVKEVASRVQPGASISANGTWLEMLAGLARRSGRPIAVTTQVPFSQRQLLGPLWHLEHSVFLEGRASAPDTGRHAVLDSAVAGPAPRARARRLPDDVTDMMIASLYCSDANIASRGQAARDSLERKCNLR